MTPLFLTSDYVLELHERAIAVYGGAAGLRDRGLLESALAAPQHVHAYEGEDTVGVAAACAFHIAENQPFIDGNKRAALAACLAFLLLHRIVCDASADELEQMMLAISAGALDRRGVAGRLRQWCRPA